MRLIRILLIAVNSTVLFCRADEPEKRTILVLLVGHLIDVARGNVLNDQGILIEGDQIKSVASVDTLAVPSGAQTIDLSHSWVLPGLIDCHTHLTSDMYPGWENASVKETTAESALRGAKNAKLTLMAGFTTVRDVGAPDFSDVALMRAIDNGWVPGPRMFPSGNVIGITGGHADVTGFVPGVLELGPKGGIADGLPEILKAVRYQIKHGAKVIKFCATAGVMTFEDSAGGQQYSEEEMRALIEEAHRNGIKVAAHAHGAEGIKTAVRAGVDSIEHGTLIDDEGIALMKSHGTFLVPTMLTWYQDTNYYDIYPEKIRAKAKLVNSQRAEHHRKAIPSGIKIAFGTDAGTFPHGINAGEFTHLVEFGLTPMQAIQTATVNAAELLGQSERLGSIRPGAFADIIAIARDPIKDVGALATVSFVMKGGEVVKQDR